MAEQATIQAPSAQKPKPDPKRFWKPAIYWQFSGQFDEDQQPIFNRRQARIVGPRMTSKGATYDDYGAKQTEAESIFTEGYHEYVSDYSDKAYKKIKPHAELQVNFGTPEVQRWCPIVNALRKEHRTSLTGHYYEPLPDEGGPKFIPLDVKETAKKVFKK